jgi:hypothetical protein
MTQPESIGIHFALIEQEFTVIKESLYTDACDSTAKILVEAHAGTAERTIGSYQWHSTSTIIDNFMPVENIQLISPYDSVYLKSQKQTAQQKLIYFCGKDKFWRIKRRNSIKKKTSAQNVFHRYLWILDSKSFA